MRGAMPARSLHASRNPLSAAIESMVRSIGAA